MNNQNIKKFASKSLKKIGSSLLGMSEKLMYEKSKLIKPGKVRSLYRLPLGYDLWLNNTGYLDKQIITKGAFEPLTTKAIKRFVKSGDVVIDVGANIGYYTVLLSKLVGATGKVFAFEPTKHFGGVLRDNIEINHLNNIEIIDLGLSNQVQDLVIDIGPSSATLHSPAGFDKVINTEKISLTTLNAFLRERAPERIDFIKIDIDGHEPLFFDGAWDALERYSPIIIFEVSHLHYLEAGVAAWDFYDLVRSKGYKFFYEENFAEITSKEDFLRRCANFAYSSNVLITKRNLI